MSKSDTPRTDAVAKIEMLTETMNYESVDALFARQLERELTAMREERDRYQAVVKAAKVGHYELAKGHCGCGLCTALKRLEAT